LLSTATTTTTTTTTLIFFFSHSGLCTILRSEAGGQDEAIARGCEDDPAYRNNAHLVDDGDLSNHVGYYDAAALYPSSGKFSTFQGGGGF